MNAPRKDPVTGEYQAGFWWAKRYPSDRWTIVFVYRSGELGRVLHSDPSEGHVDDVVIWGGAPPEPAL